MKKYKRKCPNCGIILNYSRKDNLLIAKKNGTWCRNCRFSSYDTLKKMSNVKLGTNNPMFGNHCNIGQIPPNKGKTMNKKDVEKRRKYFKYCPECGNKMKYTSKKSLHRSERDDRLCQSCNKKGERNVNYRRKFSKETLEKMSKNHANVSGKNNPMYGKTHSDYSRKLLRLKNIEWIEKNNNDKPIFPFFNPTACKIIDKYGKKNGYKFQHALNGGEYFISDLGYWVDGYDKKKNTVVEYYEKKHKYSVKKDEKRINEIREFLKCKVLIIREWTDNIEEITI